MTWKSCSSAMLIESYILVCLCGNEVNSVMTISLELISLIVQNFPNCRNIHMYIILLKLMVKNVIFFFKAKKKQKMINFTKRGPHVTYIGSQ